MDDLWAILQSGALNLAYVVLGVLLYRGLVLYGNRSGATGESFTLHGWMDSIAGLKGQPANQVGQAIVVAGLLIAGALVIAAFVRG
jgi:hypothetical protein